MKIVPFDKNSNAAGNKITRYSCDRFAQLIEALREKDLPQDIVSLINGHIEELDVPAETDKKYQKRLNQKYTEILALLKKECNLIPRNHYTMLWMVLGMSVFGLPLGIIYGQLTDNMGLLTLGLPVGMGLGVIVGYYLDHKAEKEGRQLNIEKSSAQ